MIPATVIQGNAGVFGTFLCHLVPHPCSFFHTPGQLYKARVGDIQCLSSALSMQRGKVIGNSYFWNESLALYSPFSVQTLQVFMNDLFAMFIPSSTMGIFQNLEKMKHLVYSACEHYQGSKKQSLKAPDPWYSIKSNFCCVWDNILLEGCLSGKPSHIQAGWWTSCCQEVVRLNIKARLC